MVIGLKYMYEIKLGCCDNGQQNIDLFFNHKRGRETRVNEWNRTNGWVNGIEQNLGG